MVARCPRAPASTPPRSSPPSWSAAARRSDAHADYLGARVSLEVPASRLQRALGLLAEALRAPAFAGHEIERLVRNRLDEILLELANPGRRAARQLSHELFPASVAAVPAAHGHRGHRRADRRGGRARASTRRTCGPPPRPRSSSATCGIDLDAVLAATLGGWTGDAAEPLPRRRSPPTTPAGWSSGPAGAVQTQLLIGRIGPDRHDPVWPAQMLGMYCLGGTLTSRLDRVLREEKGYTYGVRAFAQPLRSRPARGRRDGRVGAGHQRLGGHCVHRSRAR